MKTWFSFTTPNMISQTRVLSLAFPGRQCGTKSDRVCICFYLYLVRITGITKPKRSKLLLNTMGHV
jgi:hypothetical protein